MAKKRKQRTARRKPAERKAHRKGTTPSRAVCVACGLAKGGSAREPFELTRVAYVPATGWVPDERGRLPGPAFTFHCADDCLSALPETISVPGGRGVLPIDRNTLRDTLDHWLENCVLEALSRVAAAGQVVAGHDVLREALAKNEIALVLVATTAADRTRRSLEKGAPSSVPFHTIESTNEALGDRVGQRPRAAVGVPRTPAAAPLLRRLAMRAALHRDTG